MKSSTDITPENWTLATVGEICVALQYGYTASASDERCGPKFLRITDIQNGQVQWDTVPFCRIGDDVSAKYELKPGDIVFARTGGTVGKSFIIKSVPEQTVFASYLIRLTPRPEISPKYLYYFFQSSSYWEQIGLKKGGLQGNVNATTLSSLELYICPLDEQRRIVTKIETLLAELDNGIESLKTARKQLKVYRQAVLKHAFEGKLTAHWREQNKDKLETPQQLLARIQDERQAHYQEQLREWEAAVDAWDQHGKEESKPGRPKELAPPLLLTDVEKSRLSALPAGWAYLNLGSFISTIDAGKSFKCNERQPDRNEIGVAKV